MKKILSLVIVLAVVAQVNASVVKPKSPVGVSILKLGPVVKLFYRGEESGTVKVAIYNERGTAIYKETMQHTEDFMRPYNLSALPSGVYTIELTDKSGTTHRKVEHRVSDGMILAKLTRLNNQDHRYLLTVPRSERGVVTIRVYNENNKLLYKEAQTIKGDFAKVYNLNKFGGRHIFVVTDSEGNASRFVQSASGR